MDKIVDKSHFKNILENYFQVHDLQSVLQDYGLPIAGYNRKQELVDRVLQLIDEKHYEPNQIECVKHKIKLVYNRLKDIEEMAPSATSFIRDGLKRKHKKAKTKKRRYCKRASDEEIVESDNSDDSFVVSDDQPFSSASSDTDADDKLVNNEPKSRKSRKRVYQIESDCTSSSEDESASDDPTSLLKEYANTTRNKRKEKLQEMCQKKKLKTNKKSFRETRLKSKKYVSSEGSSLSEDDNDNDSDYSQPDYRPNSQNSVSSQEQMVKTKEISPIKKKRKKRAPIILSSEDEGQEDKEKVNNGVDKEYRPMEEDSDIEFIAEFSPGHHTINLSDYRFKDESDSNTYSSDISDGLENIDSDIDVDTTENIDKQDKRLDGVQNTVVSPHLSAPIVSDKPVNTPQTNEIQNQSIDSQTVNQTIVSPLSATVSESISERVTTNTAEPQIPSPSSDMSVDSILSVESIDLSPESPVIIVSEVQTDPNATKVKTEANGHQNTTKAQPKDTTIEIKKTSVVRPPQPQVPTSSIHVIQVKSPNKIPFDITVWRSNQAIKIPAPPKLPPTLVFRVINSSETIREIKKRLNNSCDEIETIDQTLKISLICPITNLKVKTPSRSSKCHHFDCFDINSFLELNYNKKIDDWKCPKCKQPAKTNDLIIDSLLMHILNHPSIDSSVDSVIFDNKAIWVPDIKLSEINVNQNNNSNFINISDNCGEDIIELDDDDDEESSPQKPVPTSKTGKQGLKNVSDTIATAKSVEKNLSNMIQTNRNQTNERRGNTEDSANYDRILLLLTSAEQEMSRRPRPSRWSNVNPAQVNNFLSAKQAFNNVPNRSQPRQPDKTPAPVRAPPPMRAPVQMRAAAPIRVPPPATVSVRNAPTSDCSFKFIFSSTGTLTMFCPSCKESFLPNTAEQHKNSAKHKELNKVTAVTVPTNRTGQQQNATQPRHNNNPRSIVPSAQPPPPPPVGIRTYSNANNNNFRYASDNYNVGWNQYSAAAQPQQQQQATQFYPNYQYTFPPTINNFYAQNPTYIQQIPQIPPPAHQTATTNGQHSNVYNNQVPNHATYPYGSAQNPASTYYNYRQT